jgi:hypothetical protein
MNELHNAHAPSLLPASCPIPPPLTHDAEGVHVSSRCQLASNQQLQRQGQGQGSANRLGETAAAACSLAKLPLLQRNLTASLLLHCVAECTKRLAAHRSQLLAGCS